MSATRTDMLAPERRERLTRMLRPPRRRAWSPATFSEEEVWDMIYGSRSGNVERPVPADMEPPATRPDGAGAAAGSEAAGAEGALKQRRRT